VGARLDLLRSTGVRYAAGRLREERARRSGEATADHALYAELWTQAASALGASVQQRPSDILEIRLGDRRTWVHRQTVGLDDPVTLRAALDKSLVHRLLKERGIPVPDHVTCDARELRPAVVFLGDHPGVVVKPASGTGGGMGTTAGIQSRLHLRRAALLAARSSPQILVEGQAEGHVHRLLFLDGELLDVVRRESPHVVGDGRSSIRELIAAENRRRLAAAGHGGLNLITATLDCVLTLERSGRSLGSVPGVGERVRVKTVTNQSGPADNHTVRTPLAPELLAAACGAVDAVGLRLAGVDLITADPGLPLDQGGGVVIEVNGSPGLHHHYLVVDPAAAERVCIPVLARVLGIDTDDAVRAAEATRTA
jgi:cyanophycin synthetase